MAWFGKSSKAQPKSDMESLGIRFEPIIFYPDRNEYELCIDLSGCPQELVKATYEMGKLKVEGQKYQTEFVQEFSIPDDCVPTGIYGQYQGEVLHINIPRLRSERPDASSKQEEDDRKATSEVGEDRDEVKDLAGGIKRRSSYSSQKDDLNASFHREKLPSRLPTRSSSVWNRTDEVKERGGKDGDKLNARVPARAQSVQKELKEKEGKDGDNLLIRIPTLKSYDQKEREGQDHDKSLTRVSTSLSPNQKERKDKEGKDGDQLPTRVPASSHVLDPSRSVKELGENYQRIPSKTVAPPPPPPPPLHAVAMTPRNQKATKFREEEENTKNKKIVNESNDKELREVKKPSDNEGNKMLGFVAKVKETGKAAVSAAMKEENRLVVMIGAVLTIVVLGASWRRRKRHIQINM